MGSTTVVSQMSDVVQQNSVSELKGVEPRRGSSYQHHLINFRMPPSKSIDISFENLSYSVKTSIFSREQKTLLNGVSGSFKSGELTAIMGPSGAGKSTLLNVLSGFINENVRGNIFANENMEDSRRSQIKNNSAYILQEDYLNPLYTVNEIMFHAADCKLGSAVNHKSKLILIENILESMSMLETKDTRCCRLSGGEKKRLNVCLELVNNPPILFLDEPTTGLDSSSCGLLISELKGLAKSGRTVICTIHQPSAALFNMFDHLYLLSSGRTIYQGDACNLLDFLECCSLPCPKFHNPADFVMDVVSGEFGNHTDKLIECNRKPQWRNQIVHLEDNNGNLKVPNETKPKEYKAPSEWQRYNYLVPMMFKQLQRDWATTYFKIILHVMIGIVIGLLFENTGRYGHKTFSNLAFIFAALVYLGFTALMPAALRFPAEIKIVKKEHFNNWYKFKTYYLAFLTIHLPVQVIYVSIFTSISYVMTGQIRETWRFCMYLGVQILNTLIFEMIGLVMGTFGPVNGVFNGSVFMVLMSLHGGFIAFFKDFPYVMYLFSYLSAFRFSFEILLTSVYGLGREKLECPANVFYCHVRNPELLFQMMGFREENLALDWIVLSVYFAVVVVLTYLRLRYTLKTFHNTH